MYFILYKDVQGQWRWNFNAANNKIIATGAEGYHNKQDAKVYDKSAEKWM